MKLISLIITFLLSVNVFGQKTVLVMPKNAKVGKCYKSCTTKDSKFTNWLELPCKLLSNCDAMTDYVKAIQFKLINNGFNDIEPTGSLDYNTVYYHNNLKKMLRKRKRKEKKIKRRQTKL